MFGRATLSPLRCNRREERRVSYVLRSPPPTETTILPHTLKPRLWTTLSFFSLLSFYSSVTGDDRTSVTEGEVLRTVSEDLHLIEGRGCVFWGKGLVFGTVTFVNKLLLLSSCVFHVFVKRFFKRVKLSCL